MLHWRDQAILDLHLDKCSAFGTWKFCSAPCLCLTREAWCDRANDSFVAKWSYSELSLARYRLHSYVTKWKVTTPITQRYSHYHLVAVTGDSLTTLRTARIDIVSDHKTWPNPTMALLSLAHPLILGLNFLKLTKSKI